MEQIDDGLQPARLVRFANLLRAGDVREHLQNDSFHQQRRAGGRTAEFGVKAHGERSRLAAAGAGEKRVRGCVLSQSADPVVAHFDQEEAGVRVSLVGVGQAEGMEPESVGLIGELAVAAFFAIAAAQQ